MRINMSDVDKYGGNGGGGFFSLKNNHDTARVRFLYNNIDDVNNHSVYGVHELEVNGKKRAVNCLREYGDPIDNCPFCKKGLPVRVKYYIPLYRLVNEKKPDGSIVDNGDGSVVIWERGKEFGSKLSSLCSHYPNLVSHIFEIERNGEAGNQKTSYEVYDCGADDTQLSKFEIPKVLGGLVMDKSADEMQYYLDRGVFPDSASQGGATPSQQVQPTFTRRTPAGTFNNNNNNPSEKF